MQKPAPPWNVAGGSILGVPQRVHHGVLLCSLDWLEQFELDGSEIWRQRGDELGGNGNEESHHANAMSSGYSAQPYEREFVAFLDQPGKMVLPGLRDRMQKALLVDKFNAQPRQARIVDRMLLRADDLFRCGRRNSGG